MNRSFFFSLAVLRTRSSPAVTLSRLGVRGVLGSNAFPSAPSLRSTDSSADRSTSFARFFATMEGSDFSRSCIIGYGFRLPDANRCCCKRSIARPPGSRTRNVATCWGLRPRRIESAACDNAAPRIAFRALNNVGIRNVISWLNTKPVVSPVNAWRPPSPTDSPMTRGQCGSLHLHCAGLPPAIPCQSPGALRVKSPHN